MRFLLYSPDSYGLGHVRRSLKIAGRLLAEMPGASARLVTGSPRAHYFDYPARCDYLRIPRVTKDSQGRYVSATYDLTLAETVDLRARLLTEAALTFAPDVFLVDHSPLGLCGDTVPALRLLGGRQSRPAIRVLGLRDVIDEPEAVRKSWREQGVIEILRRDYDRILVWGQRELFDPVEAYGIPADVAAKIRFAGYINGGPEAPGESDARERFAPRTGKLVVLTVGGGGDGDLVLRHFLEGFAGLGPTPPFEALVITGPLMSPRNRRRFAQCAARLPGVTVMEFEPHLPALLRAASLVVCMGGYNTVAEAAYAGARTVIVPRTFPRREQCLRAALFARLGVARCLEPLHATPAALVREIQAGLEDPSPGPGWGLDFRGLDALAREVRGLLGATAHAHGTPSAEDRAVRLESRPRC